MSHTNFNIKTFDDILKDIGEFGSYQKRLYFLLCLPSFTLASLLVLNVFILGVPEHRCKIPGLDNDTFDLQDERHQNLINKTIPRDIVGDRTYDRCHIYISNEVDHGENLTQRTTCTEWVYSSKVFKYTFAQQLDMVCNDAIKIPNAQMVFFFGVLVGSIVYGQLSDIIGRRKTLYLCILIQLGSSLGLIGMVEYIGFCVLMFVLCGATLGLYMTAYVMGLELVGPRKRIWTGNITQLFLTTGVMYLVLMVYLIREWKYFTLAVALPGCLFLPYYWFVCSMSYYGVVLNIGNLGGDFFHNFLLLTAAEYPAKTGAMMLMDKTGRKKLHISFLLIGGLACIGTIWPILDGSDILHPVLIAFAMIGKMCVTGAFGTIYVLSAELFPTVVRNAGMGSSSAVARVGSMLAPYIAKSADLISGVNGQAIPLTLFGVSMFVAGLLTLILPETVNRQLPESIEDAQNYKRNATNEQEVYTISTKSSVTPKSTYQSGTITTQNAKM